MSSFRNHLSDLVLGRDCAGCSAPGCLICDACRVSLHGKARILRDLRFEHISADLRLPLAIAHPYRSPLREMIYRYKDNQIPALAPFLAELLAQAISQITSNNANVLVIPIPSRTASVRIRGFDPMARIARELERRGHHTQRWLTDQRASGRSKKLGPSERRAQIAGAFRVAKIPANYRVNPRPVIIIDDVVTTGATVSEAGSELLQAGVNVIGAASLAGTSLAGSSLTGSSLTGIGR